MRTLHKSVFILFFITTSLLLNAQSIQQELSSVPGISFKLIPNYNFKEYYEIYIEQPVDHANPFSKKFKQRIYLGFYSLNAPTVINTDGYGIGEVSKPEYKNELSTLLNSNLITVEHRYFGKSIPDSMDYNYLTVKQAAADDHVIRNLFSGIFKNKWILTGISKGGQAALGYTMLYPEDVAATIVYGTAVKTSLIENKIDSMLNSFEKTPCGTQLEQLRLFVFQNKQKFIPLLVDNYIHYKLSMKQFDPETNLDYMLLELPFSFLQNGYSCGEIPSPNDPSDKTFNFITSIVPPRFYDSNNLERIKPAYYMCYHELGYYEYNLEKYRSYLHQTDYSNKTFAPQNIKFDFDKTYLTDLNKFLKTKEAESIIFVYGENDPWSSMQNTGKARKEIIKNGSHKSRIDDMTAIQKESLMKYLNFLLK
jgi:hypothetical protein